MTMNHVIFVVAEHYCLSFQIWSRVTLSLSHVIMSQEIMICCEDELQVTQVDPEGGLRAGAGEQSRAKVQLGYSIP